MTYMFTDADRKKSAEARRRNRDKADRAAAQEAAEVAEAAEFDRQTLGVRLLKELARLAFAESGLAAAERQLRISAIRTALPYCLPQLRAIEHAVDGADPINLNELEVAANRARHGYIDPASFGAGDSGALVDADAALPIPARRREAENGAKNA